VYPKTRGVSYFSSIQTKTDPNGSGYDRPDGLFYLFGSFATVSRTYCLDGIKKRCIYSLSHNAFYMSLQRLINLAKKTGDTLIIHDTRGDRDMVIMDVDRYEHLLLDASFMDDTDTEEFTDDTPSTWHSAGDLLGSCTHDDTGLYDVSDDMYEMADPIAMEDSFTIDDAPLGEEESVPFDIYGFDADERSSQSVGLDDIPREYEPAVEPIGETIPKPGEPVAYERDNPTTPTDGVIWGEEEPLDAHDDQPVFYEEPV